MLTLMDGDVWLVLVRHWIWMFQNKCGGWNKWNGQNFCPNKVNRVGGLFA